MGIGDGSSNGNQQSARKEIRDETTPLLPVKVEEEGFHEFNGASFSGAVFNLSTTIVGAGIMALPASFKMLGIIPGILMIIIVALLTEASIDMLVRYSLRYTSALSVALAVVFVVITAGIAIIKLFNGTVAMPKLFPELDGLNSIWNLFTAVPVLVTAYICHYNGMHYHFHSIDNELEDRTQIKPIVRTSLVLCSSVYIATSFFAYLLFGEGTLDDVLANFDANLGIPFSSVFDDIVRVSYAAHVMLVFPIVFFALRLNLDGLLFPTSRHISHDNKRFAIITIALLAVIYLAAILIPSIWDAFQFTGATAAVLIGFIFPAMVILRDSYGIATKRDKVLAVTMIVLAVLSNSVALYIHESAVTVRVFLPSAWGKGARPFLCRLAESFCILKGQGAKQSRAQIRHSRAQAATDSF
ncbi:hypothetical protein HU200_042759 [Digitaria exilis]|uniref:Amino acid transporter transmembrane domain-containing protein n=1 Tax=Digitaria exilis TaxID=1010633 RepID=A0A835B4U7_9POAL|nr:hypothetical protein HU200_042759 [Digitaria exilis]